jgi:hypothetical protein
MKVIAAMTFLGMFILAGAAFSAVSGIGVTSGSSEMVPVSVRANPSSYRPVYGGYTGYRAPVSSSGGYSAGK